jgi:hypothetical protein
VNAGKKLLCWVFNIHGVDGVGQTEMHTAQSVAAEPSAFGIQTAAGKISIYEFHVLVNNML